MHIVRQDGVFTAAHQDYEPVEYLRGAYGNDIEVHWVPNGTPIVLSAPGVISDPREGFSEDLVRVCVRQDIDEVTDELIAKGFVYQDISFQMDIEHQNSYMFSYLLNQEYPYTIKGVGDGYLTFDNRDQHTAFIAAGFSICGTIIQEGWALKEALSPMTKHELLSWVDDRTNLE
jgi:hypothetical protein